MMKNTNALTNEIFAKYEQVIREVFVDSLEYLKGEDREEWFANTQDEIHMVVEDLIMGDLDGESPEGQALLIELLNVDWDVIVNHLINE